MTTKIAIDTNVLVYVHDKTADEKSSIAKELLVSEPYLSTQVLSEYLNVLRRLLKITKVDLLTKSTIWLDGCIIFAVSLNTLKKAATLAEKYDFQLFDAIIVASALEAECTVLYSEDMQHNQVIEGKLTIVNPFL